MNIEEIQEIKTLIGCLDIDDIEPVNKYTANVLRKIINQYEQLQQENKRLNGAIQTYDILLKSNVEEIERLIKENQELKGRLERINNYLDKYYSMENQYWFDHIRDIVKDR